LTNPGDLERYSRPEQQLLELLREGPISFFDERVGAIVGLKTDRLEDMGIIMRCGMTPTDAMHLKGDFDEFDAEASRLGAQCLLKSYRGKEASEKEDEIEKLAGEIYELAQFRLYGQVVGAYAQDCFWPDQPCSLDDQMQAVVDGSWKHRHDASRAPFAVRFGGTATLVGVGAPTHVFLGEVGKALDMAYAVPEHAGVANAVGAAASRVTVEQRVVIYPQRGSDGVIQCYQVRGLERLVPCETIDEALQVGRALAQEQAEAEARRRGAAGELSCSISDSRHVYKATGVMEIVRDWIITARVE